MAGKPKSEYAKPIVTKRRHGVSVYHSGCRCQVCTTAASASTRRSVERQVANGKHGTAGRYRVGGCRCDLCREANRKARGQARKERYAERVLDDDGRLVHPSEKLRHGTAWAYSDHGCQCEPCIGFGKERRRTKAVANVG